MNESVYDEFFKDSDEKPFDYKALLFEFVVRWPLILACVLLALGGAYVYLRYQPPGFSGRSTVLIKQGDQSKASAMGTLASMQALGTASLANNFANEVALL